MFAAAGGGGPGVLAVGGREREKERAWQRYYDWGTLAERLIKSAHCPKMRVRHTSDGADGYVTIIFYAYGGITIGTGAGAGAGRRARSI